MASLIRQLLKPNIYRSANLWTQSNRLFSAEGGAPQTYSKEILKQLVNTNKVVVFMKGNPEAPRCGFSNAVVQILRMHGVQYDAHDVLASDELRQNIKDFTEWPTIPQVFINGEFVGGCDILLQMHQSGDLIEELKKVGIESLLLKEAEANEGKDNTKKE
ncbi:hypothetical protein FF38_02951 [Lucilia cuprina]|uniref:Glutaredoxin-related protein 5, mitochondrial n=1 Tax=Lucilia cuprina TaxID=7375 RepID=A0A0L0CID3_LUCCU|nr:mitochondrial, Glutaredoxin-related protein 5 [Lucilia cuprina]KNC31962.1 hypothetical protein FF38_02951 [Lucilia cuprina]